MKSLGLAPPINPLHQSGRLPEAERLYLKALDMMPQTEDGGWLVRVEVTLQVCRAEIIIPSGFLSMINQGSAWRSSTPASLPSRPVLRGTDVAVAQVGKAER